MNSLWRYEQEDYVSQFFQIHPENPQQRLIRQAVEIIRNLRTLRDQTALGLPPAGLEQEAVERLTAAGFDAAVVFRDYGNRVGVWRLMDVFDRFDLRCTVSLSMAVLDMYPDIAEAMLARRWEFMSHGLYNTRYHWNMSEEEEAQKTYNIKEALKTSKQVFLICFELPFKRKIVLENHIQFDSVFEEIFSPPPELL